MLKYLRLAVTALSLTACGLLIALWVRSYQKCETLSVWASLNYISTLGSHRGAAYLIWFGMANVPDPRTPETWPTYRTEDPALLLAKFAKWKSGLPRPVRIYLPYWFVVLIVAMIAALPWLPYRFSLRTLLILTTLVAVVLGMFVMSR